MPRHMLHRVWSNIFHESAAQIFNCCCTLHTKTKCRPTDHKTEVSKHTKGTLKIRTDLSKGDINRYSNCGHSYMAIITNPITNRCSTNHDGSSSQTLRFHHYGVSWLYFFSPQNQVLGTKKHLSLQDTQTEQSRTKIDKRIFSSPSVSWSLSRELIESEYSLKSNHVYWISHYSAWTPQKMKSWLHWLLRTLTVTHQSLDG